MMNADASISWKITSYGDVTCFEVYSLSNAPHHFAKHFELDASFSGSTSFDGSAN